MRKALHSVVNNPALMFLVLSGLMTAAAMVVSITLPLR